MDLENFVDGNRLASCKLDIVDRVMIASTPIEFDDNLPEPEDEFPFLDMDFFIDEDMP